MSEFSDWAAQQLEQAGYRPAQGGDSQIVHTSVMALCQVFGEMNFRTAPPAMEAQIIAIFTELANRRALPVQGDQRRWLPSRQAPPGPGTRVRIKHNAFTGAEGQALNGREAVVTGARRGDFMISFTDGLDPDGARVVAANMETQVG